jgi:hypothetical protein
MNELLVIKVAILPVLFFSFLLEGCHKDESSEGLENDMALVGNWKLTKMISEYQGETETFTESQLDSMDFIWNLKMKNDGTAEQTTNISGPTVTMPGTWSSSANQLTMVLSTPSGESGTMVYEYVIDGNLLKLNWEIPAGTKFNAEFTRQ